MKAMLRRRVIRCTVQRQGDYDVIVGGSISLRTHAASTHHSTHHSPDAASGQSRNLATVLASPS